MRRWPFVLFGLPWIYSAVYFAVVAILVPRHLVTDPNRAANYWMFGMVIVAVCSVITALNIDRNIAGAARLGLMLIVVVNLIVATGVSVYVIVGFIGRLFGKG
jgi:hypothetical protein